MIEQVDVKGQWWFKRKNNKFLPKLDNYAPKLKICVLLSKHWTSKNECMLIHKLTLDKLQIWKHSDHILWKKVNLLRNQVIRIKQE